ncbi:uncharacterized protein [Parasteatoda tepidariorum]|uniref:uncharacterized protein n=1 Tax=Parasteatoda tepidariorum TaxID=114398 RepID=UPI001C71EB43|nr:uncharacterized protein LOC122269494 [Parasteatoda tepidariorum]
MIKSEYATSKRKRWNELYSNLDFRTNDSKLWKLVKSLDKQQPQTESCSTILAHDGSISQSDKDVADILGLHYKNISKLTFSANEKTTERKARNLAHCCRSRSCGVPLFFACFSMHELKLAIKDSNLSKSPGPDDIRGQMIMHLGGKDRRMLLEIINLSWRMGRLSRS